MYTHEELIKWYDESYCLEAVKEDGEILQDIPEKMKTEEMCLIAINQDPWNIMYVPEKFKTDEIMLTAMKKEPNIIRYIDIQKHPHIYEQYVLMNV